MKHTLLSEDLALQDLARPPSRFAFLPLPLTNAESSASRDTFSSLSDLPTQQPHPGTRVPPVSSPSGSQPTQPLLRKSSPVPRGPQAPPLPPEGRHPVPCSLLCPGLGTCLVCVFKGAGTTGHCCTAPPIPAPQCGRETLSFKPQRLPSFWSGPLASRAPSCLQGPPRTSPRARTCGSHSSEVVGPAQHHAGPVAGALNQGPGQGREQEYHSQVQHGHEEGEVEALYGAQAQSTDGGAVTACCQPPAPASRLPPRLYLVAGRCFSSSRGRRSVQGALGTPRLPSSSCVSPPLLISPPSQYLRGIPGMALSRHWCEWLPV